MSTMNSFNFSDMMDLDDVLGAFNEPVRSSVPTRFERKAAAAAASGTVAGSSSVNTSAGASSSSAAQASLKTPLKRQDSCDRFIPTRSAMDRDYQMHLMTKENRPINSSEGTTHGPLEHNSEYQNALKENLFSAATKPSTCKPMGDSSLRSSGDFAGNSACAAGADSAPAKILSFSQKAPKPRDGYQNNLRVLYSQNKLNPPARKTFRYVASAPERVLDAPNFVDNYYLNLLDWSPSNVLAVALGSCVYLWNANDGTISKLADTGDDDNYISSVQWMPANPNYVAIGTNRAELQLWDASQGRQVRSMAGHASRVSALSWNSHLLSSGSRDSFVFNHDVRIAQHHVATLGGHQQEVCGLRWSPDGSQLASGGNDNLCCIWDASAASSANSTGIQSTMSPIAPRITLECHRAAVKALAWAPFQRNLLATGGGTADRCIRFFNTQSGACLNTIDTQSQVCSLLWSPTGERELLSSHGYSQNQLTLWKYPTMTKVADLTGHTQRVLHLAASPDGATVCSAAADETLRFWKVFNPVSGSASGSASADEDLANKRKAVSSSSASLMRSIR